MIAADLADALHARRCGEWWRMPTVCHGGDGYNLSFREGDNGGIVFHCHSRGCDYRTIKTAIEAKCGISLGAPLTPADRARLRQEREQREIAEAARRSRTRRQTDLLRASDDLLLRLAREAMTTPGTAGDRLAAEYHRLLDVKREMEVAHGA